MTTYHTQGHMTSMRSKVINALNHLSMLAIAAGFAFVSAAIADTPYPIPDKVRSDNLAKVNAFKAAAFWKDAPFAVASVDPMSGIRRTPDLFPGDGDFTNAIRVVAAKDEYEPASFLLFAFDDMPKVALKAGDLVSKKGARIPASAVDLTVIKIWYQMGTAWYGYHADHLRRIPTPELLLHDENLIHVDHDTKENYLRCDYKSGEVAYRWISFTGAACDYQSYGAVRNHWIHDAATIQTFVLQKNAFKQFFATIHVPESADEGVYSGEVTVSVEGKRVAGIPLKLSVLPFKLPLPATRRDLDREFLCSGSHHGDLTKDRKLAENFVAHGVLNPATPKLLTERAAKDFFALAKETGLSTNNLGCPLPGINLTTSYPAQETDASYNELKSRAVQMTNAMARLRRYGGDDIKAYAYGIDEAGPDRIRAQRSTWQMAQALGALTDASAHYNPFLLFNVDSVSIPRMPGPRRKAMSDLMHDANPDMCLTWYADPHSGPESPLFARRAYGWITWLNNYDSFSQYIIFRDDWTEFWIPKEPMLRGLMLAYKQDNGLIDTLAWEGTREAADDLKYGTLVRLLAREALKSKNINTVYAGRAANTWIMQDDFEIADLRFIRLECIRRILDLRVRLAKEGVTL